MRNMKNSIQVGVNEHSKRKVIDSEPKNHKLFFINIGNYRDISVQNRQLFTHSQPVTFWSRDQAPPTRFA